MALTHARKILIVAALVLVNGLLRTLPDRPLFVGNLADLSIRQQIATQVAGQAKQTLSAEDLKRQVNEVLAGNPDKIADAHRKIAANFRDALTYETADGGRHAYLGGFDGYYWLRLARNVLIHGAPCTGERDGQCLDAMSDAPLGSKIAYPHSAHVYLIAGTHVVLSHLDEHMPLDLSARYMGTAMMGLVILVVFLMVDHSAGWLAASISSALVGLNPFILSRTLGIDNDITILFFSTLLMGATVASTHAGTWSFKALWAAMSGVCLGLLATTSEVWPLYFLIILSALVALAVTRVATLGRRINKKEKMRQGTEVRGLAIALLATCLGTAVILVGFHVEVNFAQYGIMALQSLKLMAPPVDVTSGVSWPSITPLVDELRTVNMGTLTSMLGIVPMALGLSGLGLRACADSSLRPGQKRWTMLLVAVGSAAFVFALQATAAPRQIMLPVMLAIAAPFPFLTLAETRTDPGRPATMILFVVWLSATLIPATQGARYTYACMVPLCISAGIGAGALIEMAWAKLGEGPYGSKGIEALMAAFRERGRAKLAGFAGDIWARLEARAPSVRPGRSVVAVLVAALALWPSAQTSIAVANGYAPEINDAWTITFEQLRRSTKPDAIVMTWWDQGHWAGYYSDRRVVIDGTSLRKSGTYWMARALTAPTDEESLRIFHFLSCGGVFDAVDDTFLRPPEMLAKWVRNGALAHRVMSNLVTSESSFTYDYLTTLGLSPDRIDALRKTLTCKPPDSHLVLSTRLLANFSMMVDGLWNPYQAFAATVAASRPNADALTTLQDFFGVSRQDADRLYEEARRVGSRSELMRYAAPQARILSTGWHACVREDDQLRCPLDIKDLESGAILESFDGDLQTLDKAIITARRPADGAHATFRPSKILLASADALKTIALSGPRDSRLGVLIDPGQNRVFVGSPAIIDSTLVKLVLLDGRYSPLFQKVADVAAFDGRRITTWKVSGDVAAFY